MDLLVAYETANDSHVLLPEAKGVTGWTNKQMKHKVARLGELFRNDGKRFDGVAPHFAMLSPRPPQLLGQTEWPSWMRPGGNAVWIELPIPERLRKVTRCDDHGKADWQGEFWKANYLRYRSWPVAAGSSRRAGNQ